MTTVDAAERAAVAGDEPRRPGRRPSRARRQEIIDVAAEIFCEKGYEATSIQDIADAVGILKGSLYYYIETKEELLFAVIQEVHESALTNLERWQGTEGDALVQVRGFVESHVLHLAQNRVKVAVFFHDFRSLDGEHQAIILEERDLYDHALRRLVVAGQEQGVICPDIDAKLLSFGVLGLMNWLYQWFRPNGGFTPKGVATAFADFVVAGLACRRDSHVPGHRGALGALPPDTELETADPSVERHPSRPRARR